MSATLILEIAAGVCLAPLLLAAACLALGAAFGILSFVCSLTFGGIAAAAGRADSDAGGAP